MRPSLAALAAAAVLQKVTWGDREVEVPLARPLRVEPEEIALELADGSVLVLAAPDSPSQTRADLRRWASEFEDRALTAVLDLPDEAHGALIEAAPDRPSAQTRAVLLEPLTALWDGDIPGVVAVLRAAADQRPPPPADLSARLERRIDRPWPPRVAPPSTQSFERLTFALAQAHDLVKLVRGQARLRLRGGGGLTVLAGHGDPEVDDPALAAALAEALTDLDLDSRDPGVIVVDGPPDLVDRVQAVFGRQAARHGRVNAIGAGGAVRPPDRELSELVALAARFDGPIELWSCLELGLARARGMGLERHARDAGEGRIGLVGAMLDALPGSRLRWIEASSARIGLGERELRIRWVGPEGAPVDEAITSWRLAATAARWTGHAIDLVLAGGDLDTWRIARRGLPSSPEGHVFHLDRAGRVRARAGLLGPLAAVSRALRAVGRGPESERRLSLDDLRRRVERSAVDDFRSMVADAEFQRKIAASPPWATRLLVVAVLATYALQWRFDAFSGAGAVRAGALTGDTFAMMEPWRWMSAAFLHAAWWHIALNAWALWILGRRLEALIGPHRLVALFLVSCVGGSMLHEAFSQPGDIAVGASTGVLGLLAAQGALVLARPDLAPARIRRLLWREAWVNGLLILAISLLPFVGGLAHLGGALAGFALIGTGLLTVGVAPGDTRSPGPTSIKVGPAIRVAAHALAAVAVGCVAFAFVHGEPWILDTPEGRVRDVVLDQGALTLPLPGSAGTPERHTLPDGTRIVAVGDPLRDGLRVVARARPLGPGVPADIEAALAVRAPADRAWEFTAKGDGPTAVSSPEGPPADLLGAFAPQSRLQRRTFVMLRDGVLIHVEVTGTADVAYARLSGTWARIPAGVAAIADAWPDLPPLADLAALERLSNDQPLGSLPGVASNVADVLQAAASLRADPDAALGPLDPPRAAAVALVLAARGAGDAALGLLDHTAAFRTPALQARLRAQALEELDQPAAALAELERVPGSAQTLQLAQLAWQAGRADAATLAELALSEIVPWWFSPFGSDDALPPALIGNRGWARLLAGDPKGCVDDSSTAIQRDPSLAYARFNLGLCLLVLERPDDAATAYRVAERDARASGQSAILRASARDLRRLVSDGVPGAREQYARSFPDERPPPERP